MLVLALVTLLSPAAHADPHGIVARVDLRGGEAAEPALLVLTPAAGEPLEVGLHDGGEPPDVEAADGIFSGAGWTEGDDFTLTLKLGQRVLDAGRVSWSPSDEQRDLALTMTGEMITAEASVSPSRGSAPQGSPQAAEPGGEQAGPGGPGGEPNPGGGGREDRGFRMMPLLGLGLGLAALIALLWWWRQPSGEESGADASGPLPLPEPGLVGSRFPSLSEGLALWSASAADAPRLLGPLLTTIARHHQVALMAPPQLTPPPVHGGPVYRVEGTRPPHLERLVTRLQRRGGRGVAAVIVLDQVDAAELRALADHLPPGVGGVALVVDAPEVALPTVRVSAQGDHFLLESKAGQTMARVGPEGLVAEG